MGRIITSFYDFVLYESKMYGLSEDKKESDEKNVNKEINWDFNFESGKFLESEIGKDSLDQIKNDFKKKILPIVTNTDYIGQVITINLIASTSKVPLGPNAKTGLKNAGYKELTNKGLAGARLDTLESIIEDLLFEYLAIKGDDKENFIKDIKNKVKIKKTPKPNLGPDYKSGVDDKDDTKYKEVQKISSEIEITAEKIEEDRKISCNKSTSGRGTKGEAINNFVGYEKNLYLIAASGDKITIKFDPITVPDCFIYKYTGEYKLSVFSGNFGGILAEPFVQNKFDNLVKLANQGNIIMPEKVNKNGIYYTVLNYKKTINEIYNKNNELVNAINRKIKELGIKGDIKTLQPKFFDKDGKIEVYSNREVKNMEKSDKFVGGTYTKDYITNGVLPTPPVCDPLELQIDITKKFVDDTLKLAVFSPCAGTAFSLNSTCKGQGR